MFKKENLPNSYDIIGNIAILKFPDKIKFRQKKKFAKQILKRHKQVKTVLEKTGKFKGRLRKQETRYLLGEKTRQAYYKENNCIFRLDIDKTYFSPRLSNERKEIAENIKKNEVVLVMFAGVAPYPIVIAKNSSAKEIYSNEINREANKYAKLNIQLNKVEDKVFLLPGDIKKTTEKLKHKNKKFDVIVMPRPQLKDSFLKQAFALSKSRKQKKPTRIYYYDFCKQDEIDNVVEKIKSEAKKNKKKIKILNKKIAGEISPYKFRIRIDFEVV